MKSVFSYRVGLLAAVLSVAALSHAQETPKPDTPPAQTPAPAPAQPPAPAAQPPIKATPPAMPTPKPAPPKPAVKLPANVVARVGTQDITRDDLLGMFNMVSGRPIIDQMVQSTLLEQEAKRLGVTVTEAELQKGIQDAKERIVQQSMMMGTPKTFKQISEDEGFSEDLIRWSVRLDQLRRKTFAKSVAGQVPTRDDQVHLAHILIATVNLPVQGQETKALTPEEAKAKETDAKTKIDGILADIKAGKITFEDAAAKYSDDTANKTRGGDLGFLPPGQLDPDFEKAGFSLTKPGEITGPVKSKYGYHLIKLIERGKDETPKQKEAYKQQQITEALQNPQAMQAWINALRQKTTVTFNRQAEIVPGAKRMAPVPPAKPTPTKAKKTAS